MYEFEYDLRIYEDTLQNIGVEDPTDSSQFYSLGLSSGNMATTKQLDADYIPVDSSLFQVGANGKITINISALKEALDGYVGPVI